MDLPKASDLRDILAAARENGVTHLRIGGFEVKMAPAPAPAPLRGQAINGPFASPAPGPDGAPLRDPLDIIRQQTGAETREAQTRGPIKGQDILDALGNGVRFVPVGGPADPTSPQ